MKFTIDKNLINKISKLTSTDYGIENDNDNDKKVYFDIESLEPLLDDLLYEIEHRDNKIIELETQINNDYNPEIEIPEIHGKGISW